VLSEDQRAAHVFDHNPRHGTDLRADAGRRAGPAAAASTRSGQR